MCVPVEHVNKRGRKGMWSQPPQIKNIQSCVHVCVCVQGLRAEGEKEQEKKKSDKNVLMLPNGHENLHN